MTVDPTPKASNGVTQLMRVLRDMNGVLTVAEDWEERVACVLGELSALLPMDLAGLLLSGSERRFLAYLASPLEPELVGTVKAGVIEHYRLITEQRVKAEEFPTSFLGLHAPAQIALERPNVRGAARKGSYLSLPLLGVDEIVGVIHVFCLKRNAYDEEDLSLFSLVAAKLGSYLAHVNRHRVMEEYDREREGFMAEVIHEMKNPLTSAAGFTQLLLRYREKSAAVDTEKETAILERVQQQLWRVVQMADSVVDVTRVRAGWMALERERVDLGRLARRVAEAAQATTDKHRITVQMEGDCTVWGDVERLEQVLRNLLSNAIKFSPAGGPISVTVIRDDEADKITVAVTDQGIGISHEQQERLFERYYRADSATTRRIGGSGLGLYISHEIIRRHGGGMRIESEVGKGSTFSFTLPAATANR
jgi:signal transduction histidine kinase